MNIKDLIGKKMTKEVAFMGQKVNINKLSVENVEAIQEQAKEIEADPSKGFDVLKTVIRASVEGGAELTDEDFKGFPMDELSTLSNSIMAFSGIAGEKAGK